MFGLCILKPTHWLVSIKAAERKCLVSHDLFLSNPLKLLRIKITLLRPCNIYRKYIFNCSVRAFANNGKCWPNGLQHVMINPYPTAFPYGNGMVLHFYQQQESSTTKTVHKVINRGLKAYV